MSRFIAAVSMAASLAAAGCGATTNNPVSTPQATGPTQVAPSEQGIVPVGQQLDVRLQTTLSSETAQPEQRFEATTVVDLMQGRDVLIPAGSTVRGVVAAVDRAGRIERVGRLTLTFDRITVRGREYPLRATAMQVFESGGLREDVATAGVGAGVGGIVGGIIGGVQGAVLGAVIGAGGAVVATEGTDVRLPAGSIVRIRLDTPLAIR
jgi:hypothetical protein